MQIKSDPRLRDCKTTTLSEYPDYESRRRRWGEGEAGGGGGGGGGIGELESE